MTTLPRSRLPLLAIATLAAQGLSMPAADVIIFGDPKPKPRPPPPPAPRPNALPSATPFDARQAQLVRAERLVRARQKRERQAQRQAKGMAR